MTAGRGNREWAAILLWLGAGFLWFGVIAPMRDDQATRLAEQSRIRRERIKVDSVTRENQALSERMRKALGAACRISIDAARLREHVVAATSGLSLSPFALSVAGGSSAGAGVDAEGTRGAVLQLISRLGDPARGGFLRTASVRDRGSRWGVTLTTGVLASLPPGLGSSSCALEPATAAAEAPSEPVKPLVRPRPARKPLPAPVDGPGESVAPVPPAPTPVPPMTLVAFLSSRGKGSVSVRIGDRVQVVSVGGHLNGWTCVSIDRDEGAVFVSPSGVRIVLKAGQ